MTFAYGRDTRRRVIRALANLRNFQANERVGLSEGLTGLNGPCRRLTASRYGALPREYAVGLEEAEYVVYCYGTPIAWVANADGAQFEGDTPRINFMPDRQYSATTTYYQSLVHEAWGDKVRDPNPAKSRRDNRGTARGRTSDARYARHREASASPRRATDGYGHAPRAEFNARAAAMEVGAIRAERGRASREQILNPRYADPDWTPWNENGSNLPPGADLRDQARVEQDGWRAHP